jgi:hypothetical protein
MADLFYGVIALKNSEVDEVIKRLGERNLTALAQWLTKKKDLAYGKRNEDWKPFNGQTISQLINETVGYQTQTSLIDRFDLNVRNYRIVRSSPIRVYFIDIFALFLEKYSDLVDKLDSLIAENRECCLVMSYELPSASQDELIETYRGIMSEVYDAYLLGKLHRIAMRAEDLRNFRNYLLETFGEKELPNPAAEFQVIERPNYREHQGKQLPGR